MEAAANGKVDVVKYYLETGNPKQVSVAKEISNKPQIRIDSVHLNKFCICMELSIRNQNGENSFEGK